MPKEYVKGIEFKFLVSGPAQIGRMLNYIYLTGHNELRYKPGSRSDNLDNNVGNEWGIALLIGQNFLNISDENDNGVGKKLVLTRRGNALYDFLIKIGFEYKYEYNKVSNEDELHSICDISSSDINYIRDIFNYNFINSILYKDLCIYFDVNNNNEHSVKIKYSDFKNEFYKDIFKFYKKKDNIEESNTANTNDNQIGALKQLLVFIKYFEEDKDYIIVNFDKFRNPYPIVYDQDNNLIKDSEDIAMEKIDLYSNKALGGQNRIFYGAPGCGKSKKVKDRLKKINDENIVRTVFHPEFSNSDFVGQILPCVNGDEVTYSFNPGPFTVALLKALKTDRMVYLIIEEINRGNAAAIFGDLFQLLDREKEFNADGSENLNNGMSEYPISNPNLEKYIRDCFAKDGYDIGDDFQIFIPSNLTILATMNSSDQNVFTLDTAFKRRWYFEQVDNDIVNDNKHLYKKYYVPGTDVTWETFMMKVNDKILDNKIQNQTNEDKRMGKYFVTQDCLTKEANDNNEAAANNFAYKVLEYLWDDVCKIGKEDWFDTTNIRTLDELIDEFVIHEDSNPLDIFINIDFKK